ncbi:acetyltransferase [Tenacibaculum sp. K20-16]|nr:acetyltransferase [Tenacibaculum sp. 1_MG-2023]MCH3883143.1 acetyltransferase [Tenacibaculum aquimarinum]MDO6600881.1 acetyltransferase [Tenacibaculum sp. 1_MG-2023]
MYLFGASGHGKVVKEVLDSKNVKVDAFIDDKPLKKEQLGVSVVSSSQIGSIINDQVIISIGNNLIRKDLSKKITANFSIAKHKEATVSKTVEIKGGTVIMAGAVINAETKIGKHCIINSNAVVEHDCILGDYVHISPNATITGNTIIGEGTHVGTGATVIPNIVIGKWVTIGAGAVIIKDIPDYAVVVGNPGKIIKYKKENE